MWLFNSRFGYKWQSVSCVAAQLPTWYNTDIKQMKLSHYFVPVQHNCGTCLVNLILHLGPCTAFDSGCVYCGWMVNQPYFKFCCLIPSMLLYYTLYIVSICWLLSLDPIPFCVRRPLLNVAVYIVAEVMTWPYFKLPFDANLLYNLYCGRYSI
jgi:prepilin signal peptidase PulO-like enzyme (type II secretory pathway)